MRVIITAILLALALSCGSNGGDDGRAVKACYAGCAVLERCGRMGPTWLEGCKLQCDAYRTYCTEYSECLIETSCGLIFQNACERFRCS